MIIYVWLKHLENNQEHIWKGQLGSDVEDPKDQLGTDLEDSKDPKKPVLCFVNDGESLKMSEWLNDMKQEG